MEPSRYVIIVKVKDGYGTLVIILYAMVEQFHVISVEGKDKKFVQTVMVQVKNKIILKRINHGKAVL